MKIMFASRRPVYPLFLGGAELSFFELARGLSEAGHEVIMLGERSPITGNLHDSLAKINSDSFKWDTEWEEMNGLKTPCIIRLFIELQDRLVVAHTFLSDFIKFFLDIIDEFKPDIVCTQLEGSYEVVEYCNFLNIPVLHFVRDTFHSPNFHVLRESEMKKRPTGCIATSRFLSQHLLKKYNTESYVLYPIVRVTKPVSKPSSTNGDFRVMFSNPAKIKGGDLMLEVAAQLPEISFVVLPGWGVDVPDCWHQLSNVEIHKWPVFRMEEVYATVDLVVVPTQENEAFGRIAIEAQHFDIPVVASRHSGFKEALGDSAILIEDFCNPNVWRDTIRRLCDSKEELSKLKLLGRKNILRFSLNSIIDEFVKILDSITKPV